MLDRLLLEFQSLCLFYKQLLVHLILFVNLIQCPLQLQSVPLDLLFGQRVLLDLGCRFLMHNRNHVLQFVPIRPEVLDLDLKLSPQEV